MRTTSQPAVFELHLGDCVAGMAGLPDNSIDLVVTSPPYNLGIKYSKYEDTMERRAYLDRRPVPGRPGDFFRRKARFARFLGNGSLSSWVWG